LFVEGIPSIGELKHRLLVRRLPIIRKIIEMLADRNGEKKGGPQKHGNKYKILDHFFPDKDMAGYRRKPEREYQGYVEMLNSDGDPEEKSD